LNAGGSGTARKGDYRRAFTRFHSQAAAIDGKTVRGSLNTRRESKAIHLASVWPAGNRLAFAQAKPRKRAAIPTLLEMIALKGCIVTIDAAGCQYKRADQIVAGQAGYLFTVSGRATGG
jgi:hypothetical protein